MVRTILLLLLSVSLAAAVNLGKKKKESPLSPSSLQQFVQRVQGEQLPATTSLGSLWPLAGGPLTDLATDYKARRLNDIVHGNPGHASMVGRTFPFETGGAFRFLAHQPETGA